MTFHLETLKWKNALTLSFFRIVSCPITCLITIFVRRCGLTGVRDFMFLNFNKFNSIFQDQESMYLRFTVRKIASWLTSVWARDWQLPASAASMVTSTPSLDVTCYMTWYGNFDQSTYGSHPHVNHGVVGAAWTLPSLKPLHSGSIRNDGVRMSIFFSAMHCFICSCGVPMIVISTLNNHRVQNWFINEKCTKWCYTPSEPFVTCVMRGNYNTLKPGTHCERGLKSLPHHKSCIMLWKNCSA